eukprot:TRINITY_DN12123_c0_g1_i1.p1 TRINITY_DN12123_c0_g1~~TRINITY_DN12123_c0_g1_i1.p1  ORF type:complete len:108 (+),score=11.14 TRINITY_DN12123_c0_g1_i1:113-436(+)
MTHLHDSLDSPMHSSSDRVGSLRSNSLTWVKSLPWASVHWTFLLKPPLVSPISKSSLILSLAALLFGLEHLSVIAPGTSLEDPKLEDFFLRLLFKGAPGSFAGTILS